jgi:hypothetical protein
VARQELVEPGQQHAAREVRRRGDAHGAGQRGPVGRELRLALGQQVEGPLRIVEQQGALRRQAHGPGRPLEQASAQPGFQPLEHGAGGSGGQLQRGGRGREAAPARRRQQHAKILHILKCHLKMIAV